MFIRRFFCLLCSLCIAFSVICGPAFAASIDDIYGGNPWEDFDTLPGVDEVFSSNPPVISDNPDLLTPEPVEDEDGVVFAGNNGDSYSPSSAQFSYVASGSGSFNGVSKSFSGKSSFDTGSVSMGYTDSIYYKYSASVSEMSFNIPVNYSADNYSKLNLSVSFPRPTIQFLSGAFTGVGTRTSTLFRPNNTSLFQSVQLLVNGLPYGDKFDLSGSGGAIISQTFEVVFGDDLSMITSLGLRFYTTFSSGSKSGYLSTTFVSGSSGYQAQAIFVSIGNQPFSKYQILVDSVSPGPGVDEETKGLLGTIIGWLTSIRDTIGSVFTAIVELPGKIAIAFIDGLKSLFIPDEAGLQELKEKYQTLLETKFGFVYQSFQMLGTLFDTVVGAWGDHSDYTFEFPGISFSMQGETFTLVERQTISLDNELMDVLRGFAGTLVSLICVLALVHSMETLFIAIVSGKNYFDFLAMQREAEAEVEASQ